MGLSLRLASEIDFLNITACGSGLYTILTTLS